MFKAKIESLKQKLVFQDEVNYIPKTWQKKKTLTIW